MKQNKEYRYELMMLGQGHYVVEKYEIVKLAAQMFADKYREVVVLQRWKPTRGKPILIRPTNSKFTKMTKAQIIAYYKKKGYDVKNYGGH